MRNKKKIYLTQNEDEWTDHNNTEYELCVGLQQQGEGLKGVLAWTGQLAYFSWESIFLQSRLQLRGVDQCSRSTPISDAYRFIMLSCFTCKNLFLPESTVLLV